MASLATLEGSRLWSTELSTTPEEYTIALTAADRAEIKNALDDFKCKLYHMWGIVGPGDTY